MSDTIKTFRDLIAWQKAFRLTLAVYELSKSLPDDERYGLSSQLRRCAVSVPSNIAEGYGRGTRPEYIRFLRIARGSLCELDTQLLMARELGYVVVESWQAASNKIEECFRLIGGLLRSLQSSPRP